eukprot:TRINITY_DN16460_c0_g1_i2.p1 TRINITY_DN16460_c0_g1~~TRINITY_DN16460_c0_g1_i2.p1  ORF type:complete len:121 (+),score=25.73 TRINITY_DN16460_c0_g1_i2:80-442(+)
MAADARLPTFQEQFREFLAGAEPLPPELADLDSLGKEPADEELDADVTAAYSKPTYRHCPMLSAATSTAAAAPDEPAIVFPGSVVVPLPKPRKPRSGRTAALVFSKSLRRRLRRCKLKRG